MVIAEGSSVRPLRVLVTGATSGVGEAAARLFANKGAQVALVGRRRGELERVAALIGEAATVVAADISEPQGAEEAVQRSIEVFGGLDVAVNAAGTAGYALLEDLGAGLWREVIDTNLTGPFHIARAAGLHMREAGGGAIVNVASDLASMGAPGLAHYSASKAGLIGLTRALAVELAPTVRVNAVSPGPIDTPMLRAGIEAADNPPQAFEEKVGTIPLLRLSQPDEIAAAIYFLAVEATFSTGANLAADGGTSSA